MLNVIIRNFFVLTLLVSIFSCDSPTDPSLTDSLENSYTPLKVGMVKQYFYYSDSTYQNTKIAGRAFREDGQEVFIQQSILANYQANTIHSSYYFVRDDYMQFTSLVKNTRYPENTYGEGRIAKSFPKDGDRWYLNPSAPDSQKILITAHYVDQMTTPAGVFDDVYTFKFYDFIDTVEVYYARKIGNIGSLNYSGLVLLNYVKIGDTEFGEQVPIALLP